MQKVIKYAIIVAGGSGTRMNSTVPKQFLLLNEQPVLMHTLQRFHSADVTTQIILVLPESQINYWKELCVRYNFTLPHNTVVGGTTRFQSVLNGLNTIPTEEGMVAVHDGVRPLVSETLINTCFEATLVHKAVVPVIAPSDSLRVLENGHSKAVDRTQYRSIQTPQCFSITLLKRAYQQPFTKNFTDDASVIEALGQPITLLEGEISNIKITTPQDLLIANALLRS